ncbi:response regulator [bacterium]|nr:response regulator [bacterium]
MKKKILVVDDEFDIVDIVKIFLEGKGYEVVSAYNGEDALKLIQKEKPDLIILDVLMPGIDGFEVCQKLKSEKDTMFIPIIFLTAKDQLADKWKGLFMGAVGYITKPFEEERLLGKIEKIFEQIDNGNNNENES